MDRRGYECGAFQKRAGHCTLLGAGIVRIEHMTNLGAIGADRFHLNALPLKLIGVEGSPTRAVAVVG